jgi:hypothetical protein
MSYRIFFAQRRVPSGDSAVHFLPAPVRASRFSIQPAETERARVRHTTLSAIAAGPGECWTGWIGDGSETLRRSPNRQGTQTASSAVERTRNTCYGTAAAQFESVVGFAERDRARNGMRDAMPLLRHAVEIETSSEVHDYTYTGRSPFSFCVICLCQATTLAGGAVD